jgi:hypothetical protein
MWCVRGSMIAFLLVESEGTILTGLRSNCEHGMIRCTMQGAPINGVTRHYESVGLDVCVGGVRCGWIEWLLRLMLT